MDEEVKEAKKEAKADIQGLSEDIIRLKALKDGDAGDWSDEAYNDLGKLIDRLQESLESRKVSFYDKYSL